MQPFLVCLYKENSQVQCASAACIVPRHGNIHSGIRTSSNSEEQMRRSGGGGSWDLPGDRTKAPTHLASPYSQAGLTLPALRSGSAQPFPAHGLWPKKYAKLGSATARVALACRKGIPGVGKELWLWRAGRVTMS